MTQVAAAPPIATWYCASAIFLFGLLALILPSGYSVGAALLLLGGLYTLTQDRRPLNKRDFYLLLVLAFFTAEGIVNAVGHQLSGNGYDKILRFALAIPAFYLIRWTKPTLHWAWAGLSLGSIGAGGFAFYQKFFLHLDRPQGFLHPIQFGNLSMLMGLFCIAGLAWAVSLPQTQSRRGYVLLLSLGAVAGILGSLLSGSRGGWVGLPFVFLVLFRSYHGFFKWRTKLVVLGLLVASVVAIYSLPQLPVQHRVKQAISDIQQYRQGNSQTSLGARFEMWHAAVKLVEAKPLLGWGKADYQEAMQDLVDQKKADPLVATFTHTHNEILDQAVKHGVLGLIALLALYLVPIWYFAAYLKHPHLPLRAIAVAGTLLPVAYIDFGFSQAFLSHNSGVMMYPFWLVIWAGYLHNTNAQYTAAVATER